MISHTKFFFISEKEFVSFNNKNDLIITNGTEEYCFKYGNAILLGAINNKLILLIKNKYIISLNFPSLTVHRIIYKGYVVSYTGSNSFIWFQEGNKVLCIDSDLQIFLYDDFSHKHLLNIVYLHELATLIFIVRDELEIKIYFEYSSLPTLIFPITSLIPEIIFESTYILIISLGRSVFEYDIKNRKLNVIKSIENIKFNWKDFFVSIHYEIIKTNITIINDKRSEIYDHCGDVWKIINSGNVIYLFADSINTSICISKIDCNGKLSVFYSRKHNDYIIEIEHLANGENHRFPLLKLHSRQLQRQLLNTYIKHDQGYEKNKEAKDSKLKTQVNNAAITALFFIHGGPHQKAGNVWDPFLTACLQNNYCIYVPQYPGTFGVKNIDGDTASYGVDDFQNILFHYNRVKKKHDKIIIVGHSYGAFLALKLFFHASIELMIGINGVYDLFTIASLNPKTYSHLDKTTKAIRSPQRTIIESGEWHHIQFRQDPLISSCDLENSINRIGGKGPTLHYLELYGHGCFNEYQAGKIVELISQIECQFYQKYLNRKCYEEHH